jgi:hypothetical protein
MRILFPLTRARGGDRMAKREAFTLEEKPFKTRRLTLKQILIQPWPHHLKTTHNTMRATFQ